MAGSITIRLGDADRAVLLEAAQRDGTGLCALVRRLAEAEARRLRRAAIRADGERIVAYIAHDADAREELETYGTPVGDQL